MKSWTWLLIGGMMLCGLSLLTSPAVAQVELPRTFLSVTAAFGAGLNIQGERNERIIPDSIKVKEGGVVHFMFAGFHQIAVYQRGTTPDDITDPGSGTFVNDSNNRIYLGLSPTSAEGTNNRVESVFFGRAGNYLVICNVREHFVEEGMFAIVRVRP
jgi:plastocyanin